MQHNHVDDKDALYSAVVDQEVGQLFKKQDPEKVTNLTTVRKLGGGLVMDQIMRIPKHVQVLILIPTFFKYFCDREIEKGQSVSPLALGKQLLAKLPDHVKWLVVEGKCFTASGKDPQAFNELINSVAKQVAVYSSSSATTDYKRLFFEIDQLTLMLNRLALREENKDFSPLFKEMHHLKRKRERQEVRGFTSPLVTKRLHLLESPDCKELIQALMEQIPGTVFKGRSPGQTCGSTRVASLGGSLMPWQIEQLPQHVKVVIFTSSFITFYAMPAQTEQAAIELLERLGKTSVNGILVGDKNVLKFEKLKEWVPDHIAVFGDRSALLSFDKENLTPERFYLMRARKSILQAPPVIPVHRDAMNISGQGPQEGNDALLIELNQLREKNARLEERCALLAFSQSEEGVLEQNREWINEEVERKVKVGLSEIQARFQADFSKLNAQWGRHLEHLKNRNEQFKQYVGNPRSCIPGLTLFQQFAVKDDEPGEIDIKPHPAFEEIFEEIEDEDKGNTL